MAGRSGALIRVYGVVQGVGFRPYAARLAEKYDLVGHVKNRGGYVEVLAAPRAGGADSLRLFLHDLPASRLPGCAVLHTEAAPAQVDSDEFAILPSAPDSASPVMLPPDFAPCERCMSQLRDASDRRYNHPFISCTACGARYSIMRRVPYDRETTSMADFGMCDDCRAEYAAQDDCRHWAQTVCCHSCGPRLRLGDAWDSDAIDRAAQLIGSGGIIAVKGIGGYHLACSPFDEAALTRLRSGKRREEKPFAVMFPCADVLHEYCESTAETDALLQSSARPIVLLKPARKRLHPLVCRDSAYVGAFLPCAAHQHLLLEKTGPLVMTSGNLSGAPIATDISGLEGLPIDGVLDNDRPIEVPLDDSVLRPVSDGVSFIRRSRGYVPLPIRVESPPCPATLAMGGDLKAVFGIRKGDWCYLSQHLGDLETLENQELYKAQIRHMTRLFQINPEQIVCDLHPGYFSAQIARELGDLPIHRLQHHYAHILSVMGEHGLDEPVIGVALDGTGYGCDGALWGFEFLKCTRRDFTRCGHLSYTQMPASDSAMRDARRAAMCALMSCGMADEVFAEDAALGVLRAAQSANINTVKTSGAGRMFDAAAYLLGCGDYNHFEGQCPQALEHLASTVRSAEALPLPLTDDGDGFVLDQARLWDALLAARHTPAQAAFGFHAALAQAIAQGAVRMRDMYGITKAALSGGVFQNALLLELTLEALREKGFTVYRNLNLPAGDGGLALGQLTWRAQI